MSADVEIGGEQITLNRFCHRRPASAEVFTERRAEDRAETPSVTKVRWAQWLRRLAVSCWALAGLTPPRFSGDIPRGAEGCQTFEIHITWEKSKFQPGFLACYGVTLGDCFRVLNPRVCPVQRNACFLLERVLSTMKGLTLHLYLFKNLWFY